MEGSNRVCLLPALGRSADAAKGGRILERRSGDPEFWMSCPAKGNPAVVRKNGCQLEIGSG
jgi:hypothetical protein